MKNIITFGFALISASAFSQVAIGKAAVSSPSVSLDFGTGNRGMILPWVTSTAAVTDAVNGTMVYDLTDKKVKIKYDTIWKDLSVNTQGTTVDPLTSVDGVAIQNSATEGSLAKMSIGAVSSTPGILVLEDTNKAMVLPKVNSPHLNIINPSPGMLVYDTFNKQVAVYNGSFWTFWKP